MSVWDAVQSDEKHVMVTVVDACATEGERKRILSAASSLVVLAGTEGVQSLHTVAEAAEAFASDAYANGSAADLLVLRWPLRERIAFVSKVCDALEAIHGAGLVHGALCPENVLLDDALGPVLSEIGMVSLADSLEGDREGFFGYGGYASPEAQDGVALDQRSDVFSAARLLAFLVTEREPDPTTETELAEKVGSLAAVYRKATALAPLQRHADVAELRDDLERVRGEAVAMTPTVPRRLPGARPHGEGAPPRATAAAVPAREKDAGGAAHKAGAPLEGKGVSRARPLLAALAIVVVVAALLAAYTLAR